MELDEWTTHHIRFKDCMKKRIKDLKATKHHITVTERERVKDYFINEQFSKAFEQAKESTHKRYVVTTNTTENVNELIANWNQVSEMEDLIIIFANVKENQSWHLNPKAHNFITEPKKIKDSLKTLHESIPISRE